MSRNYQNSIFWDETKILLAEDDDAYSLLLTKLLQKNGINNQIIRFTDGQQIIDFLNSREDFQESCSDCLLILDISMPKLDGIEVLRQIKQDKYLKNIPVIMNSTTDDQRTIELCYTLGCLYYSIKCFKAKSLIDCLKNISSMNEKHERGTGSHSLNKLN